MSNNFVKRPTKIVKQTLTTSFVAFTIPENLKFEGYVANTTDDSDWEMKLDLAEDEFKYSLASRTSPLNASFSKRSADLNPTLFYVKGTAGSVLQIMFITG